VYDLFYSIFLLLQRIKYTVTDVQTRCFFLGFQLLHIKIGIHTNKSGFNIHNELLGDFLWKSISKSVGILVLIRVKNISRKALMYKIFFERQICAFEPFDLAVKLNCYCSILCLRY